MFDVCVVVCVVVVVLFFCLCGFVSGLIVWVLDNLWFDDLRAA